MIRTETKKVPNQYAGHKCFGLVIIFVHNNGYDKA